LFAAILLMAELATAQTNQNAVAVVGDIYGVHCTSYTYQESQDYLVDWGTATEHDDSFIFWQNGVGGSAFLENIYILGIPNVLMWETTSWPAGFWPNPLPPGTYTQFWHGIYPETNAITHRTVGGGADGVQIGATAISPLTGSTFTWNNLSGMTLTTGGQAGSTAKNLFEISATALTQTNAEPPNPDHVPWLPDSPFVTVSYEQISAGVFGKLDTEGNAYKVLPDNKDVDATANIKGHDVNNYHLTPGKYTLGHVVIACSLPADRTTIGIGEVVSLYGMPAGTTWSVSGGGTVSPTNGSSTTFTAGLSPTTATVHAQIDGAELTQDFSVIAPSSITVIGYTNLPPGTEDPNGTMMGAQTIYSDIIGPTNVSFENVSFRENVPAPSMTWPNGSNTTDNVKFTVIPIHVTCGGDVLDKVKIDNNVPISYIFDGTNYVDFSFANTWTDQYLNDAGVWTDYYTLSATFEFRGSDKKSRVTYLGIPGSWQGPY
jgi:hypothetical protein